MKSEALQALQHVRTTLAYQLTPEAVDSLLEPIQKALDGEVKELIAGPAVPLWAIETHNSKVEVALRAVETLIEVEQNQRSGLVSLGAVGRAYNLLEHAIRSLRL